MQKSKPQGNFSLDSGSKKPEFLNEMRLKSGVFAKFSYTLGQNYRRFKIILQKKDRQQPHCKFCKIL